MHNELLTPWCAPEGQHTGKLLLALQMMDELLTPWCAPEGQHTGELLLALQMMDGRHGWW